QQKKEWQEWADTFHFSLIYWKATEKDAYQGQPAAFRDGRRNSTRLSTGKEIKATVALKLVSETDCRPNTAKTPINERYVLPWFWALCILHGFGPERKQLF
ncbi:MAG TPA: hypothetical protein PLU64_18195, partial [Saprospiraceae bacterium]|nr:hypothetical protein [Saprospiraceae bacterium]